MVSPSADEFDSSDLRRRAELLLQQTPAPHHALPSAADMQSQLHELEVHQIELEMQNEELRRSRDAVEVAAERHADFYDFAPVGYVTLDRNGNIASANLALARMLGVDRAKLTGSRFGFFVEMGERLVLFDFIQKVFATGTEQSCELHLVRPDLVDPVAPVVALRAQRCDDPLFCRVVLMDISERIALEADVRASHELLKKSSRNVPGVIYQYRRWPDGRRSFPYASEGIADIYEVTPEQVREDASLVTARLHPDDSDAVQAAINEATRTLQIWKQEYRVNLPQRGLRWLSGRARPERLQDGSTLFYGFTTDITDRMSANANLRQVMQASEEAIAISDRDGLLTFANDAACKLLGYTLDEYRAMHIVDLLAQQNQDELPAHLERLKTEPFLRREWLLKRKDGAIVMTEFTTQHLGDEGNLAIGHDISERKHAAAALAASEQFAKATIDASAEHIAVLDRTGKVLSVNQAWRKYGDSNQPGHLTQRYGIGDNYLAVCKAAVGPNADEAEPMAQGLQKVLSGELQEFSLEYPCHSPTEQYWFKAKLTRFQGGSGNVVIAHENITASKLLQTQKESAQAELRDALVREVHHRIKNNLQGVIGLLRDFGRNHALPHAAIAKLVGQVQSVAVIHGLQGKHAHHPVLLCELTMAVAEGVGALWTTAVKVTIPQPWVPCPVAHKDAVPVALVINELITNAVKHRDPPQSLVRVALQTTAESGAVQISIVNSGQWETRPVDKPPVGRPGVQPTGGVGLELVAALLPRHGAQLSQHVEDGQVHSVLLLAPPVLESFSQIGL